MAELTPLEEKLGEVLGLAQAAQLTTKHVRGMEDGERFAEQLDRMGEEAADVERRAGELVDAIDGRKTAIREKARETKGEAVDMGKTYLGDEEEALDGFEFLSMSEAGELCHWEVIEKMAETLGRDDVRTLAGEVIAVQRTHVETVREAYLALAADEAEEMQEG